MCPYLELSKESGCLELISFSCYYLVISLRNIYAELTLDNFLLWKNLPVKQSHLFLFFLT